jgi:Rrf2 family transcriptional regulator, iron-sulfur cluster assembly transcription factor
LELTTKGRYAVMALADLARQVGADEATAQGAVSLTIVAERQNISLAYLEQLFVKLRRAGLVESARGRAGGYRLARAPGEIVVADIMAAVDESVRMTRCAGEQGDACVRGTRCVTHALWDALGRHISDFLTNVTLQDVIDGMPQAQPQPARAAIDLARALTLTRPAE